MRSVLVDRILKLATTNVAVNLSYDGDFRCALRHSNALNAGVFTG
jgi:hypothetical protein